MRPRLNRTHCPQGHELTPDNIRLDGPSRSARCKTCDRERKNRRYSTDDAYRLRALAYAHWWKVGDPQGRTWHEVKKEKGL